MNGNYSLCPYSFTRKTQYFCVIEFCKQASIKKTDTHQIILGIGFYRF